MFRFTVRQSDHIHVDNICRPKPVSPTYVAYICYVRLYTLVYINSGITLHGCVCYAANLMAIYLYISV